MNRAEVRFDNFEAPADVAEIGAVGNKPGVLAEIATAFGHELDKPLTPENLGELIRSVGPAKTLLDNIDLVRQGLGTRKDPVGIATDWVRRSGLLVPVDRYYRFNEEPSLVADVALVTGGVRNWMMRRAALLASLPNDRVPRNVILVGGSRVMNVAEGPDVEPGMTEASYLRSIIVPFLKGKKGIDARAFTVESEHGADVMKKAAYEIDQVAGLNEINTKVLVVCNAGNWPQNAGQFRRAARKYSGNIFEERSIGLHVISDKFPLGTGKEPAATHQNPFSALGQIVRNFYELAQHTDA